MNKLAVLATILVALVVTGCTNVQDTINSKRNGIFLIMNETSDPASDTKSGGIGTGFLIGENEILTNAHVVADTKKLTLKTEDSEIFEAEIVKIDPVIDLALVKIKDWVKFKKENSYTVLTLADSYDIKPLDEVYALGNPWGLMFSVSKGVVSHVARRDDAVPKFLIQTDAHVYQGNSGGPLLNAKGEVVGINSLMMAKEGGSYGFALHSDIIKKVLEDWKEIGEVKWPVIGVTLSDASVIENVIEGSPAEKAGLKKGDKIVNLKTPDGNFKIEHSVQIPFLIATCSPSDIVTFTVDRDGKTEYLDVVPMSKTSSEMK